MMKTWIFTKRNLKEMLRDPLLYIFCAGFPLFMVVMFQVIMNYSEGKTPIFELNSLIPGVMMFSYSLLMLMTSLLISKDRTQSFLKRLYTSPMKAHDYIIGYFIPYFIIGLVQSIICIILGYVCAGIRGVEFTSFDKALLLILEMIPVMMINIFIGMALGIVLNDKSAPAITSIFISCCGVIGGAWMPLDTMGEFEVIARFFPFHPAVYLGRVITGCIHTKPDTLGNPVYYSFSDNGWLFVAVVGIYLVLSAGITLILFNKRLKSDN